MGCLINPRYVLTRWGEEEQYPAIRDTLTGELDIRGCTCGTCLSTTERLCNQLNNGQARRTDVSFNWESRD